MFNYKLILTISLAPAVMLAGFILGPGNVYGQESAEAIEEVVVRGIRKSVQEALAVKQDSTNFVDAISAEDVGKLPDSNIAEALQRVTGVAIQRNRGEGDFVSIRGLGPNFVRSTLNGRTVLSATESRHATANGGLDSSTGREVNFDVLPSDIISYLEVVKSPSAEHVEGGMGGVVNVNTYRPLDLGKQVAGTVKGIYREFNEDVEPAVSGLFSWANEAETFGWLGSVSYSERYIREDNNNSYGYCTEGSFCDTTIFPIDSDGDGIQDIAGGYAIPSASLPEVYQEDRERLTLQSTMQWRFGDVHELTAELLYSERNIDNLGNIASIDCCGPHSNAIWSGFDVNPDGSRQFPARVNDNNTLTNYPVVSGIWATTDEQDIDDELLSLGLNYGLTLADWDFNADLSYSEAEGYLNFQRASITALGRSPFDVELSGGQVNLTRLPGGVDLSDFSSYQTNNADSIERFNDDGELAVELDVAYADRVRLGFRYRNRTKDVEDRTTFNVNTDKLPGAGSGIATRQSSNFLDGAATFPFGDMVFPDLAGQRAYILANNPDASFASVYQPQDSYDIEEQTLAAYVQLDLESEIGNIPITGNVGVRVVKTDTDVTGFFRPFRIENDEMDNNLGRTVFLSEEITESTISSDYVNVLPSLNLRLELRDDLFLRFAVNKSLTRPTFKQLSPGLGIANPTNRIATAGNPELVAYEALNYDFGVEWYFADSSAVYLGVFYKDIDEFIGTATTTSSATPASDGDGDGIPDGLGSDVEFFGVGFASISQPLNQGNAEIIGLEAGYQQAFDNGLGYILNATVVDSSAEFTSGANEGQEIPFEGVSDYSYNLTGYYEKHGFQARLAWSFRSEFVALSSDVFGNTLYADDYGQLDASLSYFFNDDITVFVSGLNLTDEEAKAYTDTPDRPVSFSYVGPRVEFGVRASF